MDGGEMRGDWRSWCGSEWYVDEGDTLLAVSSPGCEVVDCMVTADDTDDEDAGELDAASDGEEGAPELPKSLPGEETEKLCVGVGGKGRLVVLSREPPKAAVVPTGAEVNE